MSYDNLSKDVRIAIHAAKAAGKHLKDNFGKDQELFRERGMSKELSTRFDKESDRIIIDALSEKRPDYNLLTEESGSIDRNSDLTWVVDSLDGTSNHAAANPLFSVSIGLLKDEKILLGAIYDPILNVVYCAERGKGAFMQRKQISVSAIDNIATGQFLNCEGGDKSNERISEIEYRIRPKAKDMKKLGSAALEGAYVASGRSDGYITTKIYPWDVAAAVIIVEEAGGMVTDFHGNPYKPVQSDLVFSNGKLHDKLLKFVADI